MRVAISYPVPFQSDENWSEFKPAVEKFCRTWRENPPCIDCTLYAIALDRELGSAVKRMFDGLPADFSIIYEGHGYDIGAAQWLGQHGDHDFQISMPSRVHFHRPGWAARLVEARNRHGRGLYGTSASWESGNLHIRTACYGMDTTDWQTYPHIIDSREKGTFFEIGKDNPIGSLSDWFIDRNQRAWVVYWNTEHDCPTCMMKEANIFRRGTQENLLVFDKHSDYYANANEEEKRKLEGMCFDSPHE